MYFAHQLSIDLAAPAEEVWRVIADYARDAQWRDGVTMRHEPQGLVREGTRTFEQLRMLGSTHETEATICDVVPGRSFRFASRDGSVEGTRAVEPNGANSRLVVAIRVRPAAGLAWLAPWLGWMFRRRVERDLKRLRDLVERSAVGTVAPCVPEGS